MHKTDHFDKVLLTLLICIFGGVHLLLMLKGIADSTFAHAFDAFGGALLGLITGVQIGMRIAQKPVPEPSSPNESPDADQA